VSIGAPDTEGNRAAFDLAADEYPTTELQPPEHRLLALFRGRWHDLDMLDLGVGSGRTAHTFAPLVRRYVAIDYSPAMIDRCRRAIPESDRVRFLVGDARDLSPLGEGKFDLVLFSFNGIDYVDPAGRMAILAEVRGRLRDRESRFFFSSHSLHVFPFRRRLPRLEPTRPVRSTYRFLSAVIPYLKIQKINRSVDAAEVKRRGFAILNDGLHNFTVTTYYVTPEFQVRQLAEAGFEMLSAFGGRGDEIDWRTPTDDPWIYYLCRAR
jgi:SAM-dependent methyltransferase